MVKVAGTINKSTEVMKIVTDLVQVGSMQASMREMAKGNVGYALACCPSMDAHAAPLQR